MAYTIEDAIADAAQVVKSLADSPYEGLLEHAKFVLAELEEYAREEASRKQARAIAAFGGQHANSDTR